MLGLWRYKHGVGKVNLGLPAGYIEPGEDPAETAKRELAEEVGLRSDHWESLGAYTVDGNRGVGRCHVFLARDCHAAESQPSSDDLEEARETWLTLDEWSTHLRKGDVTTLGAAVSVLWALVRLQENQA